MGRQGQTLQAIGEGRKLQGKTFLVIGGTGQSNVGKKWQFIKYRVILFSVYRHVSSGIGIIAEKSAKKTRKVCKKFVRSL